MNKNFFKVKKIPFKVTKMTKRYERKKKRIADINENVNEQENIDFDDSDYKESEIKDQIFDEIIDIFENQKNQRNNGGVDDVAMEAKDGDEDKNLIKNDLLNHNGSKLKKRNPEIMLKKLKTTIQRTKPINNSDIELTAEDMRGVYRYFSYLGFGAKAIATITCSCRKVVKKWTQNKDIKRKKRETKNLILTEEARNFIVDNSKDKWTAKDEASIPKIRARLRAELNVIASCTTINRYMKEIYGKPLKSKITFLLNENHLDRRVAFCENIIAKNIKSDDIFFTDEKRFMMRTPLNRGTNFIWIQKADKRRFKEDSKLNIEYFKKRSHGLPKYDVGFMVAGGLSAFGVGKLIFCIGNMNSDAYKQTLDYYKADVEHLSKKAKKDLLFQQDGASCHTSNKSETYIYDLFKKNYLQNWPANSPDLSPIELLWGILESKLRLKNVKTIDELRNNLNYLWNRVPVPLCEALVKTFDERGKWVKAHDGVQYCEIKKNKEEKLWIGS